MIRIGDHIFQVHLLRHMWIETDGDHYVVFIDIEGTDKPYGMLAMSRGNAEHMLEEAMEQIGKFYGEDDYENDITL